MSVMENVPNRAGGTMVIAHTALGEPGGWPKLFVELSLGTKLFLL